ncbi:MAG: GFA family protein [Myxococcota bacterium]
MADHLQGRCHCGAITFRIPTPTHFDVCHCRDCRHWHGASPVGIDGTDVRLTASDETLTWYRGPTGAERGFCRRCGSSLFYRYRPSATRWSVFIGALDFVPAEIPLGSQYFEALKPSVYAIVPTK